jgi:hypothetical protein
MSEKPILFSAAIVTMLAGCSGPAEQTTTPSNPEYRVERLFTHEGCTVYRFRDNGTKHYVTCDNRHTSTNWTELCGKGCARNVQITAAPAPTEPRP